MCDVRAYFDESDSMIHSCVYLASHFKIKPYKYFSFAFVGETPFSSSLEKSKVKIKENWDDYNTEALLFWIKIKPLRREEVKRFAQIAFIKDEFGEADDLVTGLLLNKFDSSFTSEKLHLISEFKEKSKELQTLMSSK